MLRRRVHWSESGQHDGSLFLTRSVGDDLEAQRRSRLLVALAKKLPKLSACKAAGDHTVLILEYSDIALIDSAFGSSICCCDFCYGEFKALWPDVAFRDDDFQCQSMSKHWLADYSRLLGIYNELEISTLRHMVRCERCGSPTSFRVAWVERRYRDGSLGGRKGQQVVRITANRRGRA